MSTKPIRGQRRRGAPSLVLPGDPDGCGWIAMGDGLYQACGVNVAPWRHLTRQHVSSPIREAMHWRGHRAVFAIDDADRILTSLVTEPIAMVSWEGRNPATMEAPRNVKDGGL
jgi:hypothetical protein